MVGSCTPVTMNSRNKGPGAIYVTLEHSTLQNSFGSTGFSASYYNACSSLYV